MIGRLGAVASSAVGAIALAVGGGCGEDVKHVHLDLVLDSDDCGRVPNANDFAITALAESGETEFRFAPGAPITTDKFPGDTRQIALTVRAGTVSAFGKT